MPEGIGATTRSRLLAPWALSWPVARTAALILVGLAAPAIVVLLAFGGPPAFAMNMAYVACLTVAIKDRARFALLLAVPVALAAAVAVGLSGQPFVAACFAALACLLVAPANQLDNGLMAGLPTIVVVYLAQATPGDPAVAAVGLLAGAVVAVVVLSRIPKTGRRSPIAGNVAYLHAGTMAVAVGLTTFAVIALDVPHGYWIPMTMTMVLRPVGAETRNIAYQRIAGTVLGAVLAIALLELLPATVAVIVAGLLLALVVAYVLLGRYGQFVTFLTPFVVLSAGGDLDVAIERVGMTLLGVTVAAAIAIALVHVEERLGWGTDARSATG
jgi:hypothetical protein